MNRGQKVYTEDELIAELRTLSKTRLRAFMREGLVRPRREKGIAIFDEIDCARLHLIEMLSADFEISDDALTVFLAQIDELNELRRRILRLTRAIERQPETVRKAILAALAEDT